MIEAEQYWHCTPLVVHAHNTGVLTVQVSFLPGIATVRLQLLQHKTALLHWLRNDFTTLTHQVMQLLHTIACKKLLE